MPNSCPQCGEPLIALELEGIEIDHCVRCGGVWLDRGELQLIVRAAGLPPGSRNFNALDSAAGVEHRERRCPRCDRPLESIVVPLSGGNLRIERCRTGEGFWLDRGELPALLNSSESKPAEEALARFLGDLFDHDLKQTKKGA